MVDPRTLTSAIDNGVIRILVNVNTERTSRLGGSIQEYLQLGLMKFAD